MTKQERLDQHHLIPKVYFKVKIKPNEQNKKKWYYGSYIGNLENQEIEVCDHFNINLPDTYQMKGSTTFYISKEDCEVLLR